MTELCDPAAAEARRLVGRKALAHVEPKVFQLGDFDLTSAAGKVVLATLTAVAETERDLLIERTNAGLARARRDGKRLGRPKVLTERQVKEVRERLEAGLAVAVVAREFGVSRATIIRAREAA